MTQRQADYITESEEALEMLGKGHENAAEIHPPKTIHAIKDRGLAEYKVWGWVKISANFINHIRVLKGAKLAIWQVIALSIDESGECNLSIQEIADLSGYSYSETHESLKELDEMEYLSIDKERGRKNLYSPNFAARGTQQPNDDLSRKTRGIDGTPLQPDGYDLSSLPIENSHPTIKELKELSKSSKIKNMQIKGVEASIFAGRKTTEEDMPEWENREKAACNAFESAFGIERPWNWYPAKTSEEKTWRELRSYLVELYEADPKCFVGYAEWANSQYARGAKNASQIKNKPDDFPSAWAAYKSSEMYKKQKPNQNERPVERDEHGIIVSW